MNSRYRGKDKPTNVLSFGSPKDWNGAAPDQRASQLTFYGGTIEWGEVVTEEQYRGK